MNRFIGDFDLAQKELHITDTEKIRQMHSVLKLKAGERVVLCDGRGGEAVAEILELHKKGTVLALQEVTHKDTPVSKKVALFCALAKKDNFELIVQKATEIGIAEIVPVITERTVKTGVNMDRLHKIALEASEQSGRVVVPSICEPVIFAESLEMAQTYDTRILFEIGAERISTEDKKSQNLAIFVGPEGGWTEAEKLSARDAGYIERSLTDTTLRVETAAILAVYECLK